MSLRDLLFTMRQHPAFPDLLKALDQNIPKMQPFRPNKGPAQDQYAEWIFRSGFNSQLERVRYLLTDFDPSIRGESEPSQQEKS